MTRPAALLRAVAQLGASALESVVTWLVLAPGLAMVWLGAQALTQGRPLAGAGLVMCGVAAVGAFAALVARPLSWSARQRLLRRGGSRAGWFDARQLVWLAATLTLRAAACAASLVLLITCGVVLAAPWLVGRGDRVDLGPWRIDSQASAVVVAGFGVILLGAAVLASPGLVRADRALAQAVLVGGEGALEDELARTATSRARIVSAHDQERRRIERDLHDGVQPELLGVSMTLGLALATMPADDPRRGLVQQAHRQSLEVLDSLRRFVRGIHPQVLDDHGLAAALQELAEALPPRVVIDDQLPGRLPADVEAALYYATAELLSNTAKHAGATTTTVRLTRPGGTVLVSVHDDGHGGADPNGAGLTGVRDRLAALGGTLDVDSPAGGPTLVTIGMQVPR